MTQAREPSYILWTPVPDEEGDVAAAPAYRIVIGQRVLREVQKRILEAGEGGSLGLLLGHVGGESQSATAYVLVDRFLPSVDVVPEEADAAAVSRVLRPLLEAASLARKSVAGWYRGHSRRGPDIADAERRLHRHLFTSSWHFALVGLSDPARPHGAVFAEVEEGELRPVPFHELLEAGSVLPDGRKSTSLAWRNYASADPVVRPGETLEAAGGGEALESAGGDEVRPPARAPTPETGRPDPGAGREPAGPARRAEPPRPAARPPQRPPDRPPQRPPDRPPPTPPGRRTPEWTRAGRPDGVRDRRPSVPPRRRPGGQVPPGPIPFLLPDPPGAGRRPRRLAGLAAAALLMVVGWFAWDLLLAGDGAGEGGMGSPPASETMEFAEPSAGAASTGDTVASGRDAPPAGRGEAAPGRDAGTAEEAAPGDGAADSPSPPATLAAVSGQVSDLVSAYWSARNLYVMGRADCRELQAARARVAEAFQELGERYGALEGRAGRSAEADYRRTVARVGEVNGHWVRTGCPTR